jgi:hypothetical protein
MKIPKPSRYPVLLFITMLVAAAAVTLPAQLRAADEKTDAKTDTKTDVKQRTFASPEEAIKALVDAAKAGDHDTMHEIFGPEGKTLATGDKVQDDATFKQLCKALVQMCTPVHKGDDKIILNIGAADWPLPIPLVKRKDGQWFFDTDAGREEIITRHIGEDELNTIGVCHTYVDAQRQYASEDRDGSGVLKYAQKFKSTPGKKDGLYWESAPNEEASPFGPLIAEARAEGYPTHKQGEGPHPFHGYIFKILTKQGSAAPGGKYSYIINGNMIAGFAMIAYPADWGKSGVMTFIVNQQGKVYQFCLGPKTAELAPAITEYNPDKKWTLVNDTDTAAK